MTTEIINIDELRNKIEAKENGLAILKDKIRLITSRNNKTELIELQYTYAQEEVEKMLLETEEDQINFLNNVNQNNGDRG